MIYPPPNPSLDRTGDAAAEARENRDAGSWKSMRGTDPRPLSSQPLGACKTLLSPNTGTNDPQLVDLQEVQMFYKANAEGYKTLVDGIRMKNLVHGERIQLAEFHVDKGVKLPKHQHPQEQSGYLISGSMRFIIGEEARIVGPGDSWNIPSNALHGLEVFEDTITIEVFSPVDENLT